MVALLLLILWPVAELLVAIKVAELIGVLATLLALAITLAARRLAAARRRDGRRGGAFGRAVAAGGPPGNEVVDGALGVAGGALLIVPGFITDLLGLVLLAPPTRALVRRGSCATSAAAWSVPLCGRPATLRRRLDRDRRRSARSCLDDGRATVTGSGARVRRPRGRDLGHRGRCRRGRDRVLHASRHRLRDGFGGRRSVGLDRQRRRAFDLRATPIAHDGAAGAGELCQVEGTLTVADARRDVRCLGTYGASESPRNKRLESVRGVSGWFAPDRGVALLALRPDSGKGHESDLIAATVFEPEGWIAVDEPRLSTTFVADGRPARASLELWIG